MSLSLFFLSPLSFEPFLILANVLFAIGLVGVLLHRNVLVMLMSVELMLNAANLSFVAFSHAMADVHGQVIVFFTMAVAAAEAAVGLAIVVLIFKKFKQVDIDYFTKLRG